MAVSPAKTWVAGEVLTASDLNSEVLNILNNGQTLGFPRTSAADFAGNRLIMDSDADSSITVDTDDRLDIELSGQDLFRFDGTVTTPVNGLDFVAGIAGSPGIAAINAVGTDTNISINLVPKGSGEFLIDGVSIRSNVDATRSAASTNITARTLRLRVGHIESNHIGEVQTLIF